MRLNTSNSAAKSDLSPTGTPSRRMTSKRTPASSGSSSVRKEQNKAAARVYRERRKQRLALLEQLLEKEKTQEATPDNSQVEPGEGVEPVERRDTPTTPGVSSSAVFSDEFVPQVMTPGGVFGNSAANESSSSTFESSWPIAYSDSLFDMEFAGMNDDLNPMMASQNVAFSPGRGFSSERTTIHTTNDHQASALHPAFKEDGTPSSSALTLSQSSKSAAPKQRNEQEQKDESLKGFLSNMMMKLSTPDVKQVIYVQQNGLFGAIMENTLALGLLKGGAEACLSEDGTSPFNQDWLASGGTMQLADIRAKFAATPKDLQPLDIQITFEHHMYLDVLPFPTFREKALRALTCDPPLFDEDELCVDITVKGGLVVWGTQGNSQGMDACRSWDMRSWETKPWFLKKYWFLCGGWDDEMWKTTRWWHAMRNERLATRPPDMPTLFDV